MDTGAFEGRLEASLLRDGMVSGDCFRWAFKTLREFAVCIRKLRSLTTGGCSRKDRWFIAAPIFEPMTIFPEFELVNV
jgi:hypothetical protein